MGHSETPWMTTRFVRRTRAHPLVHHRGPPRAHVFGKISGVFAGPPLITLSWVEDNPGSSVSVTQLLLFITTSKKLLWSILIGRKETKRSERFQNSCGHDTGGSVYLEQMTTELSTVTWWTGCSSFNKEFCISFGVLISWLNNKNAKRCSLCVEEKKGYSVWGQ